MGLVSNREFQVSVFAEVTFQPFFALFAEEVVRVKGQNVGTVSTEECVPPAEVFASEEVPSLLEPLFPANAEPKVCFST